MQFLCTLYQNSLKHKIYRKLNFENDFLRFPGDSAACKKRISQMMKDKYDSADI